MFPLPSRRAASCLSEDTFSIDKGEKASHLETHLSLFLLLLHGVCALGWTRERKETLLRNDPPQMKRENNISSAPVVRCQQMRDKRKESLFQINLNARLLSGSTMADALSFSLPSTGFSRQQHSLERRGKSSWNCALETIEDEVLPCLSLSSLLHEQNNL